MAKFHVKKPLFSAAGQNIDNIRFAIIHTQKCYRKWEFVIFVIFAIFVNFDKKWKKWKSIEIALYIISLLSILKT